jgi:hypothetical protein
MAPLAEDVYLPDTGNGYLLTVQLGAPMAPKTPRQKKAAAVDKALRGMFKKLEARPVPEHISTIVDQLEAGDQTPLKKTSGG